MSWLLMHQVPTLSLYQGSYQSGIASSQATPDQALTGFEANSNICQRQKSIRLSQASKLNLLMMSVLLLHCHQKVVRKLIIFMKGIVPSVIGYVHIWARCSSCHFFAYFLCIVVSSDRLKVNCFKYKICLCNVMQYLEITSSCLMQTNG